VSTIRPESVVRALLTAGLVSPGDDGDVQFRCKKRELLDEDGPARIHRVRQYAFHFPDRKHRLLGEDDQFRPFLGGLARKVPHRGDIGGDVPARPELSNTDLHGGTFG
jgi:hypothetical protein